MAETIGHYDVIAQLGPGSLGDTLRARDSKLGRTVTITLVEAGLIESPEDRSAFLEDAQRATRLSHPSIAALYEVGEDAARIFLAWEFVPGTTLRAFMGDRPLNPMRALGLAVQAADALADGHRQGIVHGDLNPETIMVTPTGRVKLLDFGLSRWTLGGRARLAGGAGETGATLGSIAYMSPEQSLGGKVDQRTDVFSLGSVLFQMLTAQAPFAQIGNESTPVQVLQRVLPGPSSVNPRVPPELDDVLRGALMKNLKHREASAEKLSANLKIIAVGLEALSPPPVPPRWTLWRQPARQPVAAARHLRRADAGRVELA